MNTLQQDLQTNSAISDKVQILRLGHSERIHVDNRFTSAGRLVVFLKGNKLLPLISSPQRKQTSATWTTSGLSGVVSSSQRTHRTIIFIFSTPTSSLVLFITINFVRWSYRTLCVIHYNLSGLVSSYCSYIYICFVSSRLMNFDKLFSSFFHYCRVQKV